MNERKSSCQPQSQFIHQSRQKDTKRKNNILFQASFGCLKLLKGNCFNSETQGQQNYISKPLVSDFGNTNSGCDLWMFGFHFSCLATLLLQSGARQKNPWTKAPHAIFCWVDKRSHTSSPGWTKHPTLIWRSGQKIPYWFFNPDKTSHFCRPRQKIPLFFLSLIKVHINIWQYYFLCFIWWQTT